MSRETRQLLATILLAVAALWVLGRFRYPDRPATPNPVPALLTQLAPRPALNELAAESTQLRTRLGASVLPVGSPGGTAAAFRIRDDIALALLPAGMRHPVPHEPAATEPSRNGPPGTEPAREPDVIAFDGATGLTLLRVASTAPALSSEPWTPRELEEPRYLMATVASGDAIALQPAFVAALQLVTTPAWSAPIWAVPDASDLQAGSLLFTSDAELAGGVVPHGDGLAIVPGATLLADAHRLRQLPVRPPGSLGIDVQTLTPPVAAATGARGGVVLTWVNPDGPSADHLVTGDVIEAADGRWVESRTDWDVRAARLSAGDRIVLGVRRHGEWRDVQLVASAPSTAALPLGLSLRRVANAGSEVLAVDRRSAADAAGLEPGDVITLAGSSSAPTPAQVRDAFEAAAGRPVLIAVTRGTTSRIATLHP